MTTPDIDLGAIKARHPSKNWQCCRDVALLVAENERLRERVAQALRVIDDLQDERVRLLKVARATREMFRVEDVSATSLDYRGSDAAIVRSFREMANAKTTARNAIDEWEADDE